MRVNFQDTSRDSNSESYDTESGTLGEFLDELDVEGDAPNTRVTINGRVSGLDTEIQEGDQVLLIRTGQKAA